MDYANRLGAFQNSVEQSKNQLSNFTNATTNVVAEKAKLLNQAKQLQNSDLINNMVGAMSGGVAIKTLRPQVAKGLRWVDKKVLGGKVDRDTKAFTDKLKKKGRKLAEDALDKVKSKVKSKFQSQQDESNEGIEMEEKEGDVSNEGKSEDVDIPEEEGGAMEAEEGEEGGDLFNYIRQNAGGFQVEDGDKEFGEDADADRSNETNYEETKEADIAENKTIDAENKSDGADDEGDDDAEDAGDDIAEDAGEDAGEVAGEETAGTAIEGVGAGLDATGIGAVIGVPLNILGGALDIFGAIEAGKSFGDWFNEDVLGNKPTPKVPDIKLPTQPSTLASQGFQATPSYSSAVEVGGGAGGW